MKNFLGILLFSILVTAGIVGAGLYTGKIRVGAKDGAVVDLQAMGQQSETDSVDFEVVEYARGLFVPWSIVFTDKNRMLVAERDGKIREIKDGKLTEKPLIVIDGVATKGEDGLMGMTVHPKYTTNKKIYACYAYGEGDGLRVKVVTFVDQGSQIVTDKTILDNIPAAQFHAGCRVKFGPDGKLYVTTGDATDKQIAQDLDSLGGKILRLNDDGTIPADNPRVNSYIYSYGHRNPQGIAWDDQGRLFASEHGPSGFDGPGGGDEFNMIVAGGNYGWPMVSHGKILEGTQKALLVWTPAVAPASLEYYGSDVIPQFRGNIFIGGLKGEGLYRINMNGDKVVAWEKMKEINFGRIRDVVTGNDGYIYFSTSNRDGRGKAREGDDKIYVIRPVK